MSIDLATSNATIGAFVPTATPLAGTYYNWWQLPDNNTQYHYHYLQPATTYVIHRPARYAWCQGLHEDKCPRLKSVSYREDGKVERVEFFEEQP